nr:reverse transcriptase domain-containing protein [Tanacetum cinerariifolium]
RGQALERAKAILEEVHKLVDAGIMREVYYHDWLSNPVMVKNSDGSWQMCVDFTDLNKACPQDCYPLPEIDWKMPFGLKNAGATYQRLVDSANRSLGEGIKARLDKHKGMWVEELSHVLWAHRTTIKVSTGDTPLSFVYGTEAIIPAEIGMPTIRTAEVNVATNDTSNE